jgi:parallel beta-helix repeat protein
MPGSLGAAQKTITVCSSGCDYTRIQQAIDAAQPGDTIQIQAGYYYENVVIRNKSGLTLQGAGRDQVMIDGSGGQAQQKAGIFIEASKDITIKGLKVIQGYRGLEATRSTGLVIAENTFEQNMRQGIYFRTNSKGQILNNDIVRNFPDQQGNSGMGIVISSRSSAVIRENTVAENYVAGIYIVEGSKAEIDQNQILDNKPSQTLDRGKGIIVELGSEATIKNNLVSGNHQVGIEFYNDSKGLVEANQIRQTRPSPQYGKGNGIYLSGSQVTIIANIIEANAAHGIEMYGSVVTLKENVVKDNGGRGIVVSVGSKATLTQNTSSNNGDFGIVVYDKSTQAILTGNIVSGNAGAGIIVSGGATDVIIANNKISDIKKSRQGGSDGIIVIENSAAEIRENEVSGSALNGISIYDKSKATILRNKVSSNLANGIAVRNKATASIEQNEVRDNGSHGIALLDQSTVRITNGNTVSGNVCAGIAVSRDTVDVLIEGNKIVSTKKRDDGKCGEGVGIYERSSAILRQNEIIENAGAGISVYDSSKANVLSNKITGNRSDGIWLGKNASVTIAENTQITDNVWDGLRVTDGSRAIITQTFISKNAATGVSIVGNSSADLRESTITDNEKCGVWVAPPPDTSSVTGSDNTISGNKQGELCGDTTKFPTGFGGGK